MPCDAGAPSINGKATWMRERFRGIMEDLAQLAAYSLRTPVKSAGLGALLLCMADIACRTATVVLLHPAETVGAAKPEPI